MSSSIEGNVSSISSSTEVGDDIRIALESLTEWQINDISYDGQERVLKPLTFSDYVAKLALKVDWQKFVGEKCSIRHPDEWGEEDPVEDPNKPVKPLVQNAGPWEHFAKNIQEALNEMNALLDLIQITLQDKYMHFGQVDITASQPGDLGLEKTKVATFSLKKRIAVIGQQVFDRTYEKLVLFKRQNAQSNESGFLNELAELRKIWRLKKIGNTIYGDLSYKWFREKFQPDAIFEIRKSTATNRNDTVALSSGSIHSDKLSVDISLPKNLQKPLKLRITIGNSQMARYDVASFSHFRSISDSCRTKLEVAQQTLLSKDLFSMLSREASQMDDTSSVVKSDLITINLPDNELLKIALTSLDDPDPDTAHCWELEQAAYSMYCEDLARINAPVITRPSSAAPHLLADYDGLLKGSHFRSGADAPPKWILQRAQRCSQFTLERLIQRSVHISIVTKLKHAIVQFSSDSTDPCVSVQWSPHTTGYWSTCRLSLFVPLYEFCHRTSVVVEIDVSDISVTLKESEEIKFGSNISDFMTFLQLLARQQLISSVCFLAKHLGWHLFSSSALRMSDNGDFEPYALVGNTHGSKFVCIKVPVLGSPVIFLSTKTAENKNPQFDVVPADIWHYVFKRQEPLDYDNMVGKSLLQKVELLLSSMS